MNAEKNFTAGLIQTACGGDPAENLEKTMRLIYAAAQQGANVICLQELFCTRYFCQSENIDCFDLAEPLDGETIRTLSLASREKNIVLLVPFFERRAPGVYHNSLAVLDGGEVIGLYRKMHIPDDPGFYEKYYFTPGDLGFRCFSTSKGRIGALICWDQWYPEAARLTALQGASVLFYPTAIGWHPHEKEAYGASQFDGWRTIQRGHAIANGVFVAAANRMGHEPSPGPGAGIEFWGSSFICDPFGIVLAEASHDREEIVCAEIDLSRIEEVRRHWPFLRDRRIDAYGGIQRRFLDGGETGRQEC
ncbi:MAG: carbon-nitrogen hydrolase [Candidatus Omnitrophota bacterium]